MVSIIEEMPGKQSFAHRLLGGIQNLGQQGIPALSEHLMGMQQQRAENEAIQRLIGHDVSGLSSDLKKEFLKSSISGKNQKQMERANALQVGLETVDKMRGLIPSAGPSNWLAGLGTGDTARNRAELEALGRSLIPLVAAGVPIRNQREFEEYRKVITNPNSRQAQLEGALNGLQDLFERSLAHTAQGGEEQEISHRVKFNPRHPEHQAKARQLHELFKDKARVRKELEREFEF